MKKSELKKWRENYSPFNDVCLGEGMKLNVHYEEKDWIKEIGGRWRPDPVTGNNTSAGKGGYWWMPTHMFAHKLGANVPTIVNTFDPHVDDSLSGGGEGGVTVLDWLNNNKMLTHEAHGDLRDDACDEATRGSRCTIYALRMGKDENTVMQFLFYEEHNVIKVMGNDSHSWSHPEDARALWNRLVAVNGKRDKGSERYTLYAN